MAPKAGHLRSLELLFGFRWETAIISALNELKTCHGMGIRFEFDKVSSRLKTNEHDLGFDGDCAEKEKTRNIQKKHAFGLLFVQLDCSRVKATIKLWRLHFTKHTNPIKTNENQKKPENL